MREDTDVCVLLLRREMGPKTEGLRNDQIMWLCKCCSQHRKSFCLNKHVDKHLQDLTSPYLAWIFRLLEVANCRLHTSHLYGFSSPWCMRLWNTNWHFWAKPLSHSSHLYGFSPGKKQTSCILWIYVSKLSNPLPGQGSSVSSSRSYKQHLVASGVQPAEVEHASSTAHNRPFLAYYNLKTKGNNSWF